MNKIDFGAGFYPEFTGWINEDGDTVYISLISAKKEFKGKGHFSRMIEDFKKKYRKIIIPTPSNLMSKIVEKKDFLKEIRYDDNFNDCFPVAVWIK